MRLGSIPDWETRYDSWSRLQSVFPLTGRPHGTTLAQPKARLGKNLPCRQRDGTGGKRVELVKIVGSLARSGILLAEPLVNNVLVQTGRTITDRATHQIGSVVASAILV